MTPQARAQAAIELLDEIIEAARGGGAAADTIIARYFKTRRYAGSKDRRAVRDLVYQAVRLAGEPPVSGRAALIGLARERPELAALFDGTAHAPQPIDPGEPMAEAGLAPEWLLAKLEDSIGKEAAPDLLHRAPLDLRVNILKAGREAAMRDLPDASPTPLSPWGLRLAEGTNVEALPIWGEGAIEVQDEGSQLVALACEAKPEMTVVDLCAGAGGKTLALAAMMGNDGILIACDSDRARLSRLSPRAQRAGAGMIETRLLDPGREMQKLADLTAGADIVLIDAPCSGTGTWRRNPESRWRLTPDRLRRLIDVQARLLDLGAALVKPGGALVYAVCSLLPEEGHDQIDAFVMRQSGWGPVPDVLEAGMRTGHGILLHPKSTDTDGFFIAKLRRS